MSENESEKLGYEPGNMDSLFDAWSRSGNPSTEESAPEANNSLDVNEAWEAYNNETQSEDDSSQSSEEVSVDEGELSASQPVEDAAETSQPQEVSSEAIEVTWYKGEGGRKQKLEIDYSDRKKIRDAYLKAAGMGKFKKERDVARNELLAIQEKHETLNATYSALNEAWKKDGIKGLIGLLGEDGELDRFVDEQLGERERIANMSAEEKYQHQLESIRRENEAALSRERSARETYQRQIEEAREAAEMRSLESIVTPSFERYRFAGKLGDPAAENAFDEAIWTRARAALAELPDDVELTQAIVDREFRRASEIFRNQLRAQTESRVKKVVEKKKSNAAERAQVAARKGLSTSDPNREIFEKLKSGDLLGALSARRRG